MSGTAATIAILSAGNFVIGMGAFVLIGLVQPMAEALGLSPGRVGTAMTTYAVAYAILSPLLVSVTGHLSRRKVLVGALTLFAVGNLATALAPNEIALHAGRAVAAAGAGAFTPVTAAVASALAPPEHRGQALAWVVFGLTLAQVAGVPVGSFIGYTLGWRAGFGLVAALALPCLWLIWSRVPTGLGLTTVSLRDLREVLTDGPGMLAILITATYLGTVSTVYTYLAPLLEETMGWGRDGVTLVLVVFGVGAVAGNLMGGAMADRLGAMTTLLILGAAQLLLLPVFSVLPLPAWLLLVLVGVWSLGGWSFMPGQQVRLIALMPQETTVALALNAAAIYVGFALGSGLGAAAISLGGVGALGWVATAGAAISLGHMWLSRRISGP